MPMYFLNNHQNNLAGKCLGPLASVSAPKRNLKHTLFGDEHPRALKVSVFVLVLLLHVKAGLYLLEPQPATILAKPMMMEVALMTEPKPTVAPAPPAPPKAAPPPPKKIVKPVKKQKPAARKQVPLPKPESTDLLIPAPSKTEVLPDVSEASKASTGSKSNVPVPQPPAFTEASPADYGANPKPDYPSSARSRGWEGRVLLRVRVTAEGDAESVTVAHSSGHDVLDESAVEAVERWKFIPGKRGDEAVPTTVNVPIIFTLND